MFIAAANLNAYEMMATGDFLVQLYMLVFSSTGHRPASLCHGLSSMVCPSIRVLTFSSKIFFFETLYQILMKFHRNVPVMVLFRIFERI